MPNRFLVDKKLYITRLVFDKRFFEIPLHLPGGLLILQYQLYSNVKARPFCITPKKFNDTFTLSTLSRVPPRKSRSRIDCAAGLLIDNEHVIGSSVIVS
jgi:hypothetical protein